MVGQIERKLPQDRTGTRRMGVSLKPDVGSSPSNRSGWSRETSESIVFGVISPQNPYFLMPTSRNRALSAVKYPLKPMKNELRRAASYYFNKIYQAEQLIQ